MGLVEYLAAVDALMQLMSLEEEWDIPLEEREEEPFFSGEGDSFYYYYFDYPACDSISCYTKERFLDSLREQNTALDRLQFHRERVLSTLNGTVASGVDFTYTGAGDRGREVSDSPGITYRESMGETVFKDSYLLNTTGRFFFYPTTVPYTGLLPGSAYFPDVSSYLPESTSAYVPERTAGKGAAMTYLNFLFSPVLYSLYNGNRPVYFNPGEESLFPVPGSSFNSIAEIMERNSVLSDQVRVFSGVSRLLSVLENQSARYGELEQYHNRYSNFGTDNFNSLEYESSSEMVGDHISRSGINSLISSSHSRENREAVVNVNVDFTANATVSNDYDVERFTAVFADRLREELAGCAEGVHLY